MRNVPSYPVITVRKENTMITSKELQTILDAARKQMEEARSTKLWETDRQLWNGRWKNLNQVINRAISEGWICANHPISCSNENPDLNLFLPVRDERSYSKLHFCCEKCKRAWENEIDGEAAQRNDDMRDY